MAKVSIPGLVSKGNRDGSRNWYWQPSKTLKQAGFNSHALGKTRDALPSSAIIAAAQEFNAQVEAWKDGAAIPKIRRKRAEGTLGAAIETYRRKYVRGNKPNGKPNLAQSTVKTYETGLKKLEAWAGHQPIAFVSKKRVKVLRDKMMQPLEQGGFGHHATHNTLKLGRQLFKFLASEDLWDGPNPFGEFDLAAPDPRSVIWSPPARELLVETAEAQGHLSVALAIVLGYAIGQREADILHVTLQQYVALPAHKMQAEDFAALAAQAPDGQPRGIRMRQQKTGAWVEVPITGDVRRRVDEAAARARRAGNMVLLADETRGQIYEGPAGQTRFQRDFAAIRATAAETAEHRQDEALAAEIRTLEFRDLRRTCVVYLGELGLDAHLIAAITGHDIDETQRILKVYMPRTTGRAARAIAISSAREAKTAREASNKKA